MKTRLSGFILTFFLVFGCAVAVAEPQPVSAMQLEMVEQKLTHQQALMQKDIDRVQYLYSLELDRIRDIADSTDRFGLLLVVIGVLVTILLFIASFATYLTVSSKAKEEAKQAAKQWFDSHEQQHQARLDALQAKFDQLDARTIEFQDAIQANSVRMQQQVEKVKAASDTAEIQIEEAKQALQQRLNHSTEEITQLTEAQKQVLAQQNQNLREKPEAAYTFEDWDVRAFNAYEQGQLDKAVLFWSNAAEVVNATDEKVAQALFNKGVTLGQLGQPEQEIVVYDKLINQFGDSIDLVLQKQVAKTLVNKGVILAQQDKFIEAIKCCDEVFIRFGKSDALVLQEPVALALFNKGFALGRLNRSEDQINVYDELIALFGESEAPALQERVVSVLNGKGFILLIDAKASWGDQPQAQQQLNTALTLLQQAVGKSNPDNQGMILGNLAYVEYLLDQPEQAETHLREALEKGGEKLYRATLDDIAMHPIPPDAEFKALLERVRQSINPS